MNYESLKVVFLDAVNRGIFSIDPAANNYAGNYLYVGAENDGRTDLYRHKTWGMYIRVPRI